MDLFDLSAKITLDTSEYERGLTKASGETSSFGEKLKTGLGTAAKVGVAALAAASVAVGKLVKDAVGSYAEYEQLVGGVETLFKDSADVVQEYAANAYKTAGLSANEYMETVTSFSASLLQSLGNDTQAAAEYADMAITDMSDNANKMGTSMEAIQNAYQGFAKQNYTMLDNLKLGYGGTKEEMQRLIDDANKLREAQGLNADLTIESYADIVEAIHTVQTEIGITGTTAQEASSTIQGSLAMTKSAWQNLLTGLGDANADIGSLVDDLVSSVGTVLGNIMPVAEQAFIGIGTALEKAIPMISEQLPGMVERVLPSLLSSAVSLIQSLVEQLPSLIQMLVDAIVAALPILIQGAIQLVIGLVAALPEIIVALIQAIPQIIMAIIEGFAPIVQELGALFGKAWDAIVNIFSNVGQWFADRWEDIKGAFSTVGSWFSDKFTAAKEGIQTAWSNVSGWFGDRWSDIKNSYEEANTWYGEKFAAARDAVQTAWSNVGSWFGDRWSDIKGAFSEANTWYGTKFTESREAMYTAWTNVGSWFSGKWTEIQDVFSNAKAKFTSIGSDIVQGVKNGITNAWNNFTNWVTNKFTSLVNGVKKALGIASPSKVFAEIGNFMTQGLGVGWNKGFDVVNRDITKDLDFTKNINISAKQSGINRALSINDDDRTQPIILQVLLDGNVIGETSYNYMQRKMRMVGA